MKHKQGFRFQSSGFNKNMFLKIDKKILIILIVILVIFSVAGYFVFKYTREIRIKVQDSAGGVNTEEQGQLDENTELPSSEENPSVEIGSPEIELESEPDSQPGILVCLDKCGDKICQESDNECKNSMNCVCPETKQDCPTDCQ